MSEQTTETQLVIERYARRDVGSRYNMLRPEVYLGIQERQRSMLRLFQKDLCWQTTNDKSLLEIGCGNGNNLLEFLRFGFHPEYLSGSELLEERVIAARHVLPIDVIIYSGDSTLANIPQNSQDIVFQSVVFSSLLDNNFQQILANKMWQWVKPGGGILWYDFIFNNPSNPDVRGVPVRRVHELFPDGKMIVKRITLAPPISRRVCKIHPYLYHLFNIIPWLRTHVLIWIEKPKVNKQ
ncbi:class I SAM-dependent methyltransferase [uncultured Thiothrix sp.]|jgi:SAM-dependent methyltransferase|uniref:class I SAM-dependent methyltransferase n=1 Tax=uncultured Thiothrix sp. TaxID=223185 RepID=UPI00262784C6|nr:class I SAM-dependent methyltransferase [uncultured Thiothrix sp.]HMT93827.1 class I SAM-dependent methyltransferase [Thiolinea sp.]